MWQLFWQMNKHKTVMVERNRALPDRYDYPYDLATEHLVLGTPMQGPWPEGTETVTIAGGCFWGLERYMWQLPGVVTTAVGYQGGFTAHPDYEQVFSSMTGHTEAVLVAYEGGAATLELILRTFWENHDSTTPMRQGNDVGTEYRSAVYWTTPSQGDIVRASAEAYQRALTASKHGTITTELRSVEDAGPFYYAEPEHQQYLARYPQSYCNHGFNGVSCPVGLVASEDEAAS